MTTYSLRIDGNKMLSDHFTVREFACADGSDLLVVDPALVRILEEIFDKFGKPVVIKSAYRTARYNERCGGEKSSRHLSGMAADIRIEGVDSLKIAQAAEQLLGGGGGIGHYHGRFVHIDIREDRARWKQLRPGSKYIPVRSF